MYILCASGLKRGYIFGMIMASLEVCDTEVD